MTSVTKALRRPAKLIAAMNPVRWLRTPRHTAPLQITAGNQGVAVDADEWTATRPSLLSATRVAGIMDPFTESSFGPECQLLALSVKTHLEQLASFRPHLVFIESAWRGLDGGWDRKISVPSPELHAILAWCRTHEVPTAFWCKEDPVHFETFIQTAKLFDYVFTTDIDCLDDYRRGVGHARVAWLPFACQPTMHNPLELYERKNKFSFAGAYYARYAERQQDLRTFVDALAPRTGLDIFDRNFGKTDPNYAFPEEYRPYIVGTLPFSEIDKAYKGYRYAINMNSIKQSQSMSARRVYELLASNTITVGNFSRAVRNLFGSLTVCTDATDELIRRVDEFAADDQYYRWMRLQGLRKVFLEHTYEHRLAQIVNLTWKTSFAPVLPRICVVARAADMGEVSSIARRFSAQQHGDKRLVVVVAEGLASDVVQLASEVTLVSAAAAASARVMDICQGDFVAVMAAADYYGPNYLLDFALTTKYAKPDVIGKRAHFSWPLQGKVAELLHDGAQYKPAADMPLRRSMVRRTLVASLSLEALLALEHATANDVLAVDEFNYCENGQAHEAELSAYVRDDLAIDQGCSFARVMRDAIASTHTPEPATGDFLAGGELSRIFDTANYNAFRVVAAANGLRITSDVPASTHRYFYAQRLLLPKELTDSGSMSLMVDAKVAGHLRIAFSFLDKNQALIKSESYDVNKQVEIELPAGTRWIKFGFRISGEGETIIKRIMFGRLFRRKPLFINKSDVLLVTNHYPAYGDLYRNAFVHSRVREYQRRGLFVDVFRFNHRYDSGYSEFGDVDIYTGHKAELKHALRQGGYKVVLVHVLDRDMWDVLKHAPETTKVIVWVHGAEIQPWHRRKFLLTDAETEAKAKASSGVREKLWAELLGKKPSNVQFVFVSQTFADENMKDYGVTLPRDAYSVIHNFIDTDLFTYRQKTAADRLSILSVRPYASKTYANDLSVKAVELLSEKPFFDKLSFRFIGDGVLFDETVAPLARFANVALEKRFVPQQDLPAIHARHGVFLSPTRMDSQGVSRDEAMSSGLVPVTTRVASVPEFVDDTCGILVEPENPQALADAIERLYMDEALFLSLSQAAANRVRDQSAVNQTVEQEIRLIQRVRDLMA